MIGGDIAHYALLYYYSIGSSLKNWLVLRMPPPLHFAPLRGEDKYPHMLMVLG